MPFPQETVDKARAIAHEYSIRDKSKLNQAKRLFDGEFLHINYGFEDAIRQGRCGHYLHQVQRDADCFSLAGINYIIAKEAGLKPRIWWVTEMRDVFQEDKSDDQPISDHSFITVEAKGKTYLNDPFYSTFAEIKFEPGRIIIFGKDDLYGKIIRTRLYKTMKEIGEEEYVEMMDRHQSPEYGKEVLRAGQVVHNFGKRVALQLLPQDELASAAIYSVDTPLYEKTPNIEEVYMLKGGVHKDGTWKYEDGEVVTYFAKSAGWLLEQHQLKHMQIVLPYSAVMSYIENLRQASEFSGRRTPLHRLYSKNKLLYFRERGFSVTGEITKENGVDAKKHQQLLEEIVNNGLVSFGREPEEAMPFIHQYSSYTAQNIAAMCEANPHGFVYSEDMRSNFIEQSLEPTGALFEEGGRKIWGVILAKSGLASGLKEKQRDLIRYKFNTKDNFIEKFAGALRERRDNIHAFEGVIDFALFQRDNPMGKITATGEEQMQTYRHIVHTRMIDLSKILRVLEVRQFQHGLKKILAA